MADLGVGDGFVAASDAVEEVAAVALALIASGAREVDFVWADGFAEQGLGVGGCAGAGDVDPAVGADEADALGIMSGTSYVH